jgi:hypothetical protein
MRLDLYTKVVVVKFVEEEYMFGGKDCWQKADAVEQGPQLCLGRAVKVEKLEDVVGSVPKWAVVAVAAAAVGGKGLFPQLGEVVEELYHANPRVEYSHRP